MTATQLLSELETLSHTARIRRMVELGRAAAHDPEFAALLTTLEQGDFYERFLALHSCFGSSNGAHVLRALGDPSRIIRGTAISLTVLTCDEEQLRQALRLVPRNGRLPLLWKLHHHGYGALIDEFLAHLAETNDLHLRKFLPCGSSALVRRFIGYFQYRMGLADWRRLARRHPVIAAELLHEKAASTTQLDVQLVAFANGVLPSLAAKQPDHALKLVEALTRTVPLSRLDLDALLLKRPAEMVDLVLQGEDPGELPFHRIAHRLDHQRLLALLPRVQREQEGRRHLALSTLATRPEERFPYAAFVPWDKARSLLGPFLHDPSEKIRTIVFHTLTQVVRYERNCWPDLLALICTYLHEPDPVRGKIVDDLAELPRSIWRSEHLEALEQIIQSIINAFDTSSYTVGALLLADDTSLRVRARVERGTTGVGCSEAWSHL